MKIKKIIFLFTFLCSALIKNIYCTYTKKSQNSFLIKPFTHKEIKKSKKQNFLFKKFKALKKVCKKLYRTNKVKRTQINKKLGKTYINNIFLDKNEFDFAIKRFILAAKKSSFGKSKYWLDKQNPNDSFFGIGKEELKYKFFVQKMIVSPNAQIAIHPDIHSDLQSLMKYLKHLISQKKLNKKFKIIDKDFYIVFLGDYVGGWLYGAEVLYTLFRLKIKNPNRVILLRGNHEDIFKNKINGFAKQFIDVKLRLSKKEANKYFNKLGVAYTLLPSALYIGVKNDEGQVNYSLFCHGGLEPRFNPNDLLSDKRKILYQWIEKLDISWFKNFNCDIYDKPIYNPSNPKHIGFIWNDFIVGDDQTPFAKTRFIKHHGLYRFGKPVAKRFFKACSKEGKYYLKTMFTGHQHSDKAMAKKFLKHNDIYRSWSKKQWDGKSPITFNSNETMVWTLNASPWWKRSDVFAKYPYFYDTHAILKLNKKFKNWILSPKNLFFDPVLKIRD